MCAEPHKAVSHLFADCKPCEVLSPQISQDTPAPAPMSTPCATIRVSALILFSWCLGVLRAGCANCDRYHVENLLETLAIKRLKRRSPTAWPEAPRRSPRSSPPAWAAASPAAVLGSPSGCGVPASSLEGSSAASPGRMRSGLRPGS